MPNPRAILSARPDHDELIDRVLYAALFALLFASLWVF